MQQDTLKFIAGLWLTLTCLFLASFSYGQEIYLSAVGDVMLSRNVGTWTAKALFDHVFTQYHPITADPECRLGGCLVFANLESPFSLNPTKTNQTGTTFVFRANIKNIKTLEQLEGPNQLILSTANNHDSNAGIKGMILTNELLDNHGIEHMGTGFPKERPYLRIRKDGVSMCFQAYAYNKWSYHNSINKQDILDELTRMKQDGCRIKIISLHRGTEYKMTPSPTQKQLAHEIIDGGANLILGHHPHVPQPIERYGSGIIVYSMGNLVFDQDRGSRGWTQKKFDWIWDFELKKKTVPTYLGLNPLLKFTIKGESVNVDLERAKLVKIVRGQLFPSDPQTQKQVLDSLILPGVY